MNDGEQNLEDSAIRYWSGLLSSEERAWWEQRLASDDPAALEALRRASHVIDGLFDSIATEEPSPAVRDALLKRIAANSSRTKEEKIIRDDPSAWHPTGMPGVDARTLHRDLKAGRQTFLLRLAPGAILPDHPHHGAEECLILEGSIQTRGTTLRAGDYLWLEAGSQHGSSITEEGCTVLIMAGL